MKILIIDVQSSIMEILRTPEPHVIVIEDQPPRMVRPDMVCCELREAPIENYNVSVKQPSHKVCFMRVGKGHKKQYMRRKIIRYGTT